MRKQGLLRHLDRSNSTDCSYVHISFKFMFQTNSASLIHDRICTYVMVQLYLGIGVTVEYLSFSLGYF